MTSKFQRAEERHYEPPPMRGAPPPSRTPVDDRDRLCHSRMSRFDNEPLPPSREAAAPRSRFAEHAPAPSNRFDRDEMGPMGASRTAAPVQRALPQAQDDGYAPARAEPTTRRVTSLGTSAGRFNEPATGVSSTRFVPSHNDPYEQHRGPDAGSRRQEYTNGEALPPRRQPMSEDRRPVEPSRFAEEPRRAPPVDHREPVREMRDPRHDPRYEPRARSPQRNGGEMYDRQEHRNDRGGRGGYDDYDRRNGYDEYGQKRTGGGGQREDYQRGGGGGYRDEYASQRGGYQNQRAPPREEYRDNGRGYDERASRRQDGYEPQRYESNRFDGGGGQRSQESNRGGHGQSYQSGRDDYGSSSRGDRGGGFGGLDSRGGGGQRDYGGGNRDGGGFGRSNDYGRNDGGFGGGRDGGGGGGGFRGVSRDSGDDYRGGRGGGGGYGGSREFRNSNFAPVDRNRRIGGGGGYGGGGFGSNDESGNGPERAPAGWMPTDEALSDLYEEDRRLAEVANVDIDNDVTITGDNVNTTTISSWDSSPLHPTLIDTLVNKCGYKKPRKIQAAMIPQVISGRDVVGHAETGSGKTAAFVLPIISKILEIKDQQQGIRKAANAPYCLVLAPTRELVEQLYDQFRKFANETSVQVHRAYGQIARRQNAADIMGGCDVLCGCLGRIFDFLDNREVLTSSLQFLVMDECDRMLDRTGQMEVEKITCMPGFPGPEKRQTIMLTATSGDDFRTTCQSFLKPDYVTVSNGVDVQLNKRVRHNFVFVTGIREKNEAIYKLLTESEMADKRTLVFVATKLKTDSLATDLCKRDVKAMSINGDRSQQQRENAMKNFRKNITTVLIGTDLCERGLDINGLQHVVNFDVPDDRTRFVHRAGRTGRVQDGLSTTIIDDSDGKCMRFLPDLVKALDDAGQEVPDRLREMSNNPPPLTTGYSRDSYGGGGSNFSNFGSTRAGGYEGRGRGGGFQSSRGGGFGGGRGGYGGDSDFRGGQSNGGFSGGGSGGFTSTRGRGGYGGSSGGRGGFTSTRGGFNSSGGSGGFNSGGSGGFTSSGGSGGFTSSGTGGFGGGRGATSGGFTSARGGGGTGGFTSARGGFGGTSSQNGTNNDSGSGSGGGFGGSSAPISGGFGAVAAQNSEAGADFDISDDKTLTPTPTPVPVTTGGFGAAPAPNDDAKKDETKEDADAKDSDSPDEQENDECGW